jgi:hypothetical protein
MDTSPDGEGLPPLANKQSQLSSPSSNAYAEPKPGSSNSTAMCSIIGSVQQTANSKPPADSQLAAAPRPSSERPVIKLSVQLLATFNGINQKYYSAKKAKEAAEKLETAKKGRSGPEVRGRECSVRGV